MTTEPLQDEWLGKQVNLYNDRYATDPTVDLDTLKHDNDNLSATINGVNYLSSHVKNIAKHHGIEIPR